MHNQKAITSLFSPAAQGKHYWKTCVRNQRDLRCWSYLPMFRTWVKYAWVLTEPSMRSEVALTHPGISKNTDKSLQKVFNRLEKGAVKIIIKVVYLTVVQQQEKTVIPEMMKLIWISCHSYCTLLLESESRGTVIWTVNSDLFILLQEE